MITNICLDRRSTELKNLSRIGDSYYFISNIFFLLSQMNEECSMKIKREIENFKIHCQKQTATNTKSTDLTAEQK